VLICHCRTCTCVAGRVQPAGRPQHLSQLRHHLELAELLAKLSCGFLLCPVAFAERVVELCWLLLGLFERVSLLLIYHAVSGLLAKVAMQADLHISTATQSEQLNALNASAGCYA